MIPYGWVQPVDQPHQGACSMTRHPTDAPDPIYGVPDEEERP